MKTFLFSFACLLLVGCLSGPQITLDSYGSDGKLSRFGPYFENEKFPVGGAVLVDAVISLGPERLPKNWKPKRQVWIIDGKPSHDDGPAHYSDGEVEAVLEFYFTNLTDKPVELKIEGFQCQLFRGSIGPDVMVIPPKQWAKSTPLVALTSNYQIKPWDYSMSVVIDGKAYPIQDKLVRMTIEQLKARHG
jgi:hypothetical protein